MNSIKSKVSCCCSYCFIVMTQLTCWTPGWERWLWGFWSEGKWWSEEWSPPPQIGWSLRRRRGDKSYTRREELRQCFKWSAPHQALQWPDKEPFMWIRWGGGGKHQKHAGLWVMRTGIEKHWIKVWIPLQIILRHSVDAQTSTSLHTCGNFLDTESLIYRVFYKCFTMTTL